MAQLRQDYQKFRELQCEVVVIVPNGPQSIARYVQANGMPYRMLGDKGARVAREYGIETRHMIITAYTPSVFVVDRAGVIRYRNYQRSYIEEPDNRAALDVLERL